jgi:hypothetical protein
MSDFRRPETKEFMIGFTVEDCDYTASDMKLHIPELMMDRAASDSSSDIQIPSDIFKSKENIHVSTSVSNNNYISIKVSKSFTGTFKALEYDSNPSPHFPKGSRMVIFIPNTNLDEAVVIPFI